MKNPLQEIRKRKNAERQQQEDAQWQRKERLRQLENRTKKTGFQIPHPVKAIKTKREIKTLRKEIAAFEQKKQNNATLLLCLGGVAVTLCILGALGAGDNTVKQNVSDPAIDSACSSTIDTSVNHLTDDTSSESAVQEEYLGEDAAQQQTETEESPAPSDAAVSIPSDSAQTTVEDALEQISPLENNSITEPAPVVEPEPFLEYTPVTDPVSNYEPMQEPTRASAVVHGTGRTVSLAPGTLVWLSATGEKFHNKNNCGRMNPEKASQVTFEEAVSRGYEACEKCY